MLQADDLQIIASLPPMPRPSKEKTAQARVGILFSVVALATVIVPLHASSPGDYPPPMTVSPIWIGVLWAEAVAILACVIGILHVDPCTIARTPETCLPLPPIVATSLHDGTLDDLRDFNILDEPSGRVFCVRCLVWRPAGAKGTSKRRTHHCRICQRCSVDFDHHCVLFGRCIAGDGCGGNMGFFKLILLCMVAGFVTCFTTVVAQTEP